MVESDKKLGEYLYENLSNNIYLKKLMKILSTQYVRWLLGLNYEITAKQKQDLLQFADLLAKSISIKEDNDHKNRALKIVAALTKMYPDDPRVSVVTNEVLTNFNNFLPREGKDYELKLTLDHLWNEVLENYQKEKRQIPGQEDKSFIGKQDLIFQSLNRKLSSFSAPTSMGKTFLIEKYIELQVKSNIKKNFAIVVPSRALITEVRSRLIDDLDANLKEKHYRVVSHPDEYQTECEGKNFIFVVTPERLSVLIARHPELRLSHIFIDESQKATEFDSRSAFYYEIFDQIAKWEIRPKITFASPLVPNPGIFKRLIETDNFDKGLRIIESPVSQQKIIFDLHAKNITAYDELNKQIVEVATFEKVPSIPQIILSMRKIKKSSKCDLIYYGSKEKAISDAVIVSRKLSEIDDLEIKELSDYVSRKIHPKYILVELIKKGVAFHTGDLPINVRIRIEDACRAGILKMVFCTSTLLEGVNLPADNLFVTTLQNGTKTLSTLDFLNLIGRVGRLGHSMMGNVFLITGEKKKSRSNLKAYLSKLNEEPKKVELSVDSITPKQVAAIKETLKKGELRLDGSISKAKDYDLVRKLSLLYIKELKDNHTGVIRNHFSKNITQQEEKTIMHSLNDRYKGDLEDDINFSSDQSEKLKEKVIQEDLKDYPDIYVAGKLNVQGTVSFLLQLGNIFNWSFYEKSFIGASEDPKTRLKIVEDNAKLLLLWISGYSLGYICDLSIHLRNPHNENNDIYFLNRGKKKQKEIPNISWETITINKAMNRLQQIQFVLGKYFMKVSQELANKGTPPKKDWYRYLGYGTDSDLRIWLQQNGYSRESSEFIEANKNRLVFEDSIDRWKLSKNIKYVDDVDVVSETKEIMVNVPEIFTEA